MSCIRACKRTNTQTSKHEILNTHTHNFNHASQCDQHVVLVCLCACKHMIQEIHSLVCVCVCPKEILKIILIIFEISFVRVCVFTTFRTNYRVGNVVFECLCVCVRRNNTQTHLFVKSRVCVVVISHHQFGTFSYIFFYIYAGV